MLMPKPLHPRKFMKLAIEVMRSSIPEPRSDGKASPKVGAVLVKPDGSSETAYRGELRHGDHAEFTLLERKNRSERLDGSILFATLEPCAPNSRRHPKLGCAERIVNARIKEVWVGIEDPDPTVDRKGIQHLQDHGVTVHMFDPDLQEIIREENKTFIDQALERAAAVPVAATPKPLSPLEAPLPNLGIAALSPDALSLFRSRAQIPESVDSPEFRERLLQLGLLRRSGDTFVPTGFGYLLFGTEPRQALPQAGLIGTIHYANGREEPRNFDGPLVGIPLQVLGWLRDKLPNTIDRSEAFRQESTAVIQELVREGVVNALVHRNYAIAGAKCQLIIAPERIKIASPGRPVEPITLEQLQSLNAPTLSRNPVLHYVFARMELAEERGLGLKSFQQRAAQAGLPPPTFAWNDPYLELTIYLTPSGFAASLPAKVRESLTKDELEVVETLSLAGYGGRTKAEVAHELAIDDKKAQRLLTKLVNANIVERIGQGRATRYELALDLP
jgi:ATP-dependent DNA helicase RecG